MAQNGTHTVIPFSDLIKTYTCIVWKSEILSDVDRYFGSL